MESLNLRSIISPRVTSDLLPRRRRDTIHLAHGTLKRGSDGFSLDSHTPPESPPMGKLDKLRYVFGKID